MAGKGAFFRVTTSGENESTVSSANKIEFDGGIVPDATGNMVRNRFKLSRDFSVHPSPKRTLNQIKDGKLGTSQVTIAGVITAPDTSSASANLYNWMIQDASNDDFKKGRFGLRLDDFPIFDLTPSATIGYILIDIEFQQELDFTKRIEFVAILRRNGFV